MSPEAQSILKVFSLIYNLTKEDELRKVLNTIGELEYKAALESLDNLKMANNKESQLYSVIYHLESAYNLFERNARKQFAWSDLLPLVGHIYHMDRIGDFAKMSQTSLLIAWCYSKLNEKSLCIKYSNKALANFNTYINKSVEAKIDHDEMDNHTFPTDTVLTRDKRRDRYRKELEPAKQKLEEKIIAIKS